MEGASYGEEEYEVEKEKSSCVGTGVECDVSPGQLFFAADSAGWNGPDTAREERRGGNSAGAMVHSLAR
jgi:hypothetical protein